MQQWAAHHARHAVKAFAYSLDGLKAVFLTETAFKQECAALVLLPLLGASLGFSAGAVLLVIGAWLALMAIELLNSGLESVCNLVSPDYHPFVKKAKDAGSAAVLLSVLANACLWGFLLYIYW